MIGIYSDSLLTLRKSVCIRPESLPRSSSTSEYNTCWAGTRVYATRLFPHNIQMKMSGRLS